MAPFTPNSSSSSVSSKRRSKSSRAGVTLPVARIGKFLRSGHFARRVGTKAALYLTAVVEYLTAEIFELSAYVATDNKRSRITPRHILLAVRQDEELDNLLRRVTMGNAGVLPKQLLPKTATVKTSVLPSNKQLLAKSVKTEQNNEPSQEY